MSSFPAPYIIVALDVDNEFQARTLVDELDPQKCRLKIGKEMFTRFGPQFVKELINQKFSVFLDLKFHDIPNTVAKACQAAADLGVFMVNVHASGGSVMMQAAKKALTGYSTLLIAVTVLTSLEAADLAQLGINATPEEHTNRLAKLAQESGLDGVVCSGWEIKAIRSTCGDSFCLVVPGIRLPSAASDDQKRIMTPQEAIKQGADYLVIGRPITQSDTPKAALNNILDQVSN